VNVIAGDYTDQGGADAVHALLEGDRLPTAVLCSNDWSATGMITTLGRRGVRVPHDLSVVGYDDSLLARRTYLDITSVVQDTAAMAAATMAAVDRRLSGESDRPTVTVLEPRLVVRSSTALPRVQPLAERDRAV
jgi:DNA-binding LacI/PurR family transcriptional regulator